MALSITVSISGSPSEFDVRAAQIVVNQENQRRALELDANGEPLLPQLPISPLGALANSYRTILGIILDDTHASYITLANEAYVSNADRVAAFRNASDSVRAQIDTLLGL